MYVCRSAAIGAGAATCAVGDVAAGLSETDDAAAAGTAEWESHPAPTSDAAATPTIAAAPYDLRL